MAFHFVLFSALLLFNIWFFLIWPKRALAEKVATILQIVAVYTFTLGVLDKVGVLSEFKFLAVELTSPDLSMFLAANFAVVAIGFQAMALAMMPAKTTLTPMVVLHAPVLILLMPFALLSTLVYFLIVMPWAYVAQVLISIPIDALLNTSGDYCITAHVPGEPDSQFCIKAAVEADTFAVKNFLIAIPALAIAFGLKVLHATGGQLVDRFGTGFLGPQWPWRRRLARYGLWALQGLTTMFIILLLTAPFSLLVVEGKPGVIYGMIMLFLLFLASLFLLFRRLGRWRRALTDTEVTHDRPVD